MKLALAILSIVALAGCSTMQPPRYSSSVDNVYALRTFDGARLAVADVTQSGRFDSNCRLMGPIQPADGLTIPQFIGKAFNDELKMAGIHAEDGTKISGDVKKISFSSIDGLTNGNWDIVLLLTSSNGQTMEVANKYEFKSGFDAITACNATADALSPAVQDLIKTAVTDPRFKSLL